MTAKSRIGVRDPLSGATAELVVIDDFAGAPNDPAPPPRVLSIEMSSPHFHPCYTRVGVRIDGVERNDIAYYNMNDMSYKTEHNTSHLAETIEPYWRYQPSRQQRRAEERFRKRKA